MTGRECNPAVAGAEVISDQFEFATFTYSPMILISARLRRLPSNSP